MSTAPAAQEIPAHSHWYKGDPAEAASFDDIPLPSAGPAMSMGEALGVLDIEFDGETFYLKAPKINALAEVHSRIAQYESLTLEEKSQPESAKVLLAAVVPLLRRRDEVTGKLRATSVAEAGDYMDMADVVRVIELAFPKVEPGPELDAAGINQGKTRTRKTGR